MKRKNKKCPIWTGSFWDNNIFLIGTVSFREKIVSFREKKRSRCEKTFKNINILLIFFLFCYRIHLATFKWKNLDNEQQKKQKERKMHMEDTSLKITGANKSFLNKLTNTISKILIPTKVGINGMLITVKRNSMIMYSYNYHRSRLQSQTETFNSHYHRA